MSLEYFPFVEQGTDEWLALRKSCVVTGSEFAAALGLCPYKSRAVLVKQKIGEEAADDVNWFMQWGTRWEPHVADAYATLCKGRRVGTFGFVTYTSKAGTRFGCSPDRIVYDENGAQQRLVEIKCSQIQRTTVELYHLPQLLAQSVFLDCNCVDYVAWSEEQVDPVDYTLKLNIARVSFDRRLWTDYVLPELEYFASLVERKMPARINSKRKRELIEAFQKYTTVEGPVDF